MKPRFKRHTRVYRLTESELTRFKATMRLLRLSENGINNSAAYVIYENPIQIIVWDATPNEDFIATLRSYGFTHDQQELPRP